MVQVGGQAAQAPWPGLDSTATATDSHICVSLSCHIQWLIHIMFQMSGYSVREVLKNSTPHPSSRGEGGLDPPESQPSPKSLNFLLILYFSRSFLEHVSCVLLHSCGVIAATEGLPPLQGIYTGIRGARINKKRKNFTPLLIFQKRGEGSLSDFLRLP